MLETRSDSYRQKTERELDLTPSMLRPCAGEMVAQQGWRWPHRAASCPAAVSWADGTAGELAGRRVSSHGMAAGRLQTSWVEAGMWDKDASLSEV